MSRSLVGAVVASLGLACGSPAVVFEGRSDDAGIEVVTRGPLPSVPGEGLPCGVASLLQRHCSSCHGPTPSGGAPYSIVSRSDLVRQTATGTVAARSLARMRDASAPMPPGGLLASSEVSVLESWVNAGTPAGTCAVDAGMPGPLTCASGMTWSDPSLGSGDMNPGLACRSCHLGQNFNGQNPTGLSETFRAYWFAGTIFPGVNERNACLAQPPSGLSIEILDGAGTVQLALTPRGGSGNFYSAAIRSAPTWLPYTARVKRNGVVISSMRTPQMSGDCNTCHTERGLQGAPGRITWMP